MTPQRHQQVKRLFLAASELSASEAAAFLQTACGEDVALRKEVDELLQHHRPTTFLGEPSESTAGLLIAREDLAALSRPADTLTAGTIVAERYRIVSLLGRGGMGEVYRADDLELEQTVALKFLPARLKTQLAAWEALRNEVRLARQITHTHVVRIHDLTITDEQILISMEYVAGEDLSTLLKRVGRLPREKLLSVARELAEGLAAAHRVGILHRDLKPSNIMLDGQGHVRILDFGIASVTSDAQQTQRPAGTPGYIAPELLAGQPPSPQSDLYAYGLVVYAAATGATDATPTLPATGALSLPPEALEEETDDELQLIVAQCLQADPRARPASSEEIVARLARRDPLTEALAAGRVPSPEVVAAAHAIKLPRWQVHGLLAAGLLLLMLVLGMADRTLFLPRCGLVKSPAVLAETSRRMLGQLGHVTEDEPQLSGIVLDDEAYDYLRASSEPQQMWDDVHTGRWPMAFYWFRSGDPRLPRGAPLGEPIQDRLPPLGPDAAAVRLDGHGRLLTYATNLESTAELPPGGQQVDWDLLFALAQVKREAFVEQIDARGSLAGGDSFVTWRGPHPADEREVLVIHGAKLDERVVLFDLRQPWERAGSPLAEHPANHWAVQVVAIRTSVWIATFLGGLWLAWLHTARGDGDTKGARRLALFVGFLVAFEWLVGAQHTFDIAEELTAVFAQLMFVIFAAATAGVLYLSVEPIARRYWPRTLTGWTRMLQGRWRDQIVGKEVLLGAVVGLVWVVLVQLDTLIPVWCGWLPARLKLPELGFDLADYFAIEYKVQVIVRAAIAALGSGLLWMFTLLLFQMRVKNVWISMTLFVIATTLVFTTPSRLDSAVPGLTLAIVFACVALLATRVGLLSLVTARFVMVACLNSPLTLDGRAWFATTGWATTGAIGAVLLLGWWTANRDNRHPISATR